MKHLPQRLRLFKLVTFVFAALGILGQTLVICCGYDTDLRVYAYNNPLGLIVNGCLFTFFLILLILALTVPKDASPDSIPPCGNGLALFASLSGVAMICASFLMLLDSKGSIGPLRTFSILLVLLSLPAGYYGIRSALTRKVDDRLLNVLGFFPVLWLGACLIRTYFDRTSAINDPVQILLQLSLAAVMLYFLTELRTRVGKPAFRLRLLASAAAILLGSAASVSVSVLFVIDHSAVSSLRPLHVVSRSSLFLAITELLLVFFIAGRLMAQLRVPIREADSSADPAALSDGGDEKSLP